METEKELPAKQVIVEIAREALGRERPGPPTIVFTDMFRLHQEAEATNDPDALIPMPVYVMMQQGYALAHAYYALDGGEYLVGEDLAGPLSVVERAVTECLHKIIGRLEKEL